MNNKSFGFGNLVKFQNGPATVAGMKPHQSLFKKDGKTRK